MNYACDMALEFFMAVHNESSFVLTDFRWWCLSKKGSGQMRARALLGTRWLGSALLVHVLLLSVLCFFIIQLAGVGSPRWCLQLRVGLAHRADAPLFGPLSPQSSLQPGLLLLLLHPLKFCKGVRPLLCEDLYGKEKRSWPLFYQIVNKMSWNTLLATRLWLCLPWIFSSFQI